MTDPVNYEEIVRNIRADAAKISGARNDAYALTQPAASTAPTFDEYSKSLGYQNLDYEAKNQVQQSWLAQHGSTWKRAGANPEADLASFAKNDKPKFEITNTDWIDRFAQAAIQSGASQFNVIANEMQPGAIKDFLSNRGQQGLLDAKAIEQKFSPLTLDTMKKEARVAAELDKKYGGNIPATEEVRQALANIGGDPIGRIASAAGSSVTQFPGMAVQAAGGALAATGVGVGPGAALIAGGKVLSTALGASSVAGEVGQGAFDEVMKLTPKQLYSHPTFQAALSEAKKVGLSEDSANLVAQRAVASEAMSFGARMGATVGAVGGAVSANLGTGAIAQQAGKQAAKHFLKHAGIEMATEGVEGAITQVAQNKAAQSGGVDVALGKGVITAGIEEAYGGLGQSAAASGIGKTAGALADIAKATPVKAPDVVTAPTTTPETLAKRMEHMPEYVKTMAEDLVNTIVATPNPTPEVKAEIDAAKSALLGLGFTQADLNGLYGTTVKADAVVSPDKTVSPVVNPGNPEQVTVGSYKPAETGGEPGTQAPTRLVTELAAQGPITLESINQKAVDHERGYSGWVQSTQSEPSRVPKQEFISGTADNMVLTALQLGLPMDQAAQSYAQELQSTQATGSGNNSASNLGSRLAADGKSLVSESDYQASQLGTVPDLVGKYVLYGNAEGYVVQRPQGLYVVDTRPGNTQDIFIEGGESQSTPAQLGVQLLSTPTVKVPTKRQGSGTSVSQQVETAQLTYDQILFNDALDLLVMSMEPAQAEAVLTAIDARLGDGATTAQVAKEIENAINQFDQQGSVGEVIDPTKNTQFTSGGFSASSSTDVSPGSKNGLAEATDQIKTRHTIASTRAKLESWLYGLDPKLEGKTLGEMLPDVILLENLPSQVIAVMEDRKIKTGLPFQDAYGVDTENVKDQAVSGFRDGRRGITVLFTKNMTVDADPISTLIHETWHKFQGRESDGGIIATANSWANKPAGSVENTAYLNGLQATQGTDITKGQQEFIPYILNSLWEQGVRPGQGAEASGWVDKALAYLQKLVNFVVMKATGNPRKLTPQELMDIAVGLIRDDANGANINKWLGPKEKVSSQPSFSVADIAKLSDKNMSLKEFSQQFAGDIKQSDKTVEQANKIANSYVLGVTTGSSDYLPNVTGASLSYKQYLMMPDGLTYDPANVNHITAADLTKSIYEAVKSGKIEQALAQEAKSINESRAKDLGGLAKYLHNNPDYRPTEAAVILKAASKWGMRLTTNNDKSVVQLVEITNKNATAIAVLNGLDASSLEEKLFEGMPLKAAFQSALQKNVDAREKAAKDSGKEGWVVYKKSDKHEDAVALRDGVAGREWCTAGAVSTAAGQLSQGDFHVFYKNGQPLVALRTVGGRLGEAPRGSLPSQALTEFERGVAERRLRGIPESGVVSKDAITGGKDFLDDQKVLNDIQSGAIKQYSDKDLWMLQGYKMKAGNYLGGSLSKPALESVKSVLKARKPPNQWHLGGYRVADTDGTTKDLATAVVVSGNLVLQDDASAPHVTTVGGDLRLFGNASAPHVTTVGGDLRLFGNASAPHVTTVGGDLRLFSASASAPLVTTVGGNLSLFSASASAPLVTTVGGNLVLQGDASAPHVTTIGGNLVLQDDASAPHVTTVGGDLRLFGNATAPLVAHTNIGKEAALKGTPLDPNYVAPKVEPPLQVAPTVTGGEDFLADQKVLNDIQSGAIKDYSDPDLWMLQGYKMKAGDYKSSELPQAAIDLVDSEVISRHSMGDWEDMGFYRGDKKYLPLGLVGVKYVVGKFVPPPGNFPSILRVQNTAVEGKTVFENLEFVGGDLVVDYTGDLKAPSLKNISGFLTVNTPRFDLSALETVGSRVEVYLADFENTKYPKFKSLKYASLVDSQVENSPMVREVNFPNLGTNVSISHVDFANDAPPDLGYSMFTPNQPKTLSEKLDVINSGRLKAKVPDWQQIKDKTAEYLVDVSRPFDVWARSFGSAADQARLLQNKTLAKTRAGALTSEVDAKFSQPLAKALQDIVSAKHAADISAAKEMVGEWMTVRYAQIKNADFITQDQQAVDDASPGSFEHQDALDKQTKRLSAINSSNDNLDPTQTQLGAGVAGGYNNATAAKVQGLIEAKVPVAMLEAATQPVYDMLKYKATLDIKTGKTAVSQSVKWLNSPYYVPLTGDPRNDDSTSDVFGTGSLNQGKDKKAVGRTGSLAQNGIDAAYEQIAKSTNYHGWLPFKQELTSTYEKLVADAGGDTEKVWKDSGIKRFREGPGVDIQNSIIVRNGADVTKNGSGWVYTLDSQDAIDGLRRVNLEAPNSFLAAMGWGTTIMSKMVTMWMPGFAVINAWRDGPERFTNLWTRTLANYPGLDMGKVALQATGYFADPRTLLTTRVVVAEKLGMFEWAKALSDSIPDFMPGDSSLLSEMLKAGASSTTGSYLSRDSSQLAEKLAKINRWDTKTKNLLVIWNDSFELKAPFAMYKALRNNGVDEKAAAATVLATMDFGKTGRAMAPIKALYMFAQPIATGSHQLFLTAGTTKGQVAGVAMLAASMGLYAMLSEMGGEDELLKKKKLDELGSFTLERSIPVPIGNNTYLKVPVPFGLFQLAWASGVNLMRGITGVQTPAETVGELLKLGVKTFAPVSPSEVPIMRDPATWFMQTLAPSFIGKTIVNVASNKTAFGGTLDNRANVKPGEPMWKMARKDTPELYVSASKWLLQNFNVNTSPEVIHEWLKGLTPGVLNEGTKAYIDNPAKDARGVPHVNQWFDRYLVQQTDSQFIDRLYYKAQAEVLDLRLKKNSDTKSAGNPLTGKENQLNAALRGDDNAESNIRKQWGALRKQNNEGLLTPEQYKTRYQQLDKQETDARRRFLVRYNELTK